MSEISNYIAYSFLFVILYFQVFLLVTLFENRKKIKADEKKVPAHLPSVSVIVPCFNEEKTISATLKSLLHLDYPRKLLQIIVVDDGSIDNTFKIAKGFEKRGIKLLHKEQGGKHTALNLGLKHSQTDLVGCLDADSFVSPVALREIVKHFGSDQIMAVTPAVRVHEPRNIVQRIQQAEYDLGIFLRKMFGLTNSIYVAPGPFSIFRKEVFEKIGGYRFGHHTEDMEITMRMHAHHMAIVNSHTAAVTTSTPDTVVKLLRQRFRWVTGFLKNAIDYRSLFFKKEHGVLGLLTLPIAIFGVFASLYFTLFSLTNLTQFIIKKLASYKAVSYHLTAGLNFDWFYLNSELLTFLSIILIATTIFMIVWGKKLAGARVRIGRDVIYFLLFYGLLAPIWVAKSLYNVLLFKESTWK